MLLWVTSTKNEKIKSWFQSRSKILYWNDILYNSELLEKNVGMLNFVTLDYSAYVLSYAVVFWEKAFVISLFYC